MQGAVSIVRELHVYGTAVPVASKDPTKFQHQGFGKLVSRSSERMFLALQIFLLKEKQSKIMIKQRANDSNAHNQQKAFAQIDFLS